MVDASLAKAEEELSNRSREELDQLLRLSDQSRRDANAALEQSLVDRRLAIGQRLGDLSALAAHGAFGASFDDISQLDEQSLGPTSLIRRGAIDGRAALYPLFHDRGWLLQGPPEQTIEEIRAVLVRSFANLPLKHLRVDLFDPRIEGRLGAFSQLRSAHPNAFPAALSSAGAFGDALESAAKLAAENAEAIAADGARNLGDLWRMRTTPFGEYRLIVVLNYPEGIDRSNQELLVRLGRSGGPNGVTLLVQSDPDAVVMDDHVRPSDLSRVLSTSRIEPSGELLLSGYPAATSVRSEGAVPASLVHEVINAASERAAAETGPVVPLAELIADDIASPWTYDSASGLDAPIALAGQRALSINLRSQNPPVSNILIGGAVGQGKSNLLLDIIYALATRYSPIDLELHLLDFKSGLEFQRFAADSDGRNWLPHAKVLSLESDKAFGVAVLRHVVTELERRSALFKVAGVSGIEDYRAGGHQLTRLLLIIDEFQVIFDGDDALTDEAVQLLERLARQGRALGVHLLLSSQTTSGVSGLRVKGESIFAQFPVRISLKNTTAESEAILAPGNKAAADLTYRGEIIVNRNFGHDSGGANERAISAFADDTFVSDLQADLWRRSPSGAQPLVFVSTDFARWPTTELRPQPGQAAVGFVGRPVAVTDEPVVLEIDDDIDQAIAVVGSDDRLAVPVIAGLVRSLSASLAPERIIVIDLAAPDGSVAGENIAPALDGLDQSEIEIVRIGRDRSVETLTGLVRSSLHDDGPSTLVVGLGWQRWGDLDQYFPVSPDDDFNTFRFGDLLNDLATRGALSNVHLLGWWTTLRSLEAQFGFRYDGIRHFVTARLAADDYRSLTSALTPLIEGYPRVGYIDRAADNGPTVAIPFELAGWST